MKHNTLVHFEETNTIPSTSGSNMTVANYSTKNINTKLQPQVILATAVIKVENSCGEFIECRCLLDCGAQSNFITADTCKRLGTKLDKTNYTVMGVGQIETNIRFSTNVNFKSTNNSFKSNINCLVLEKITEPLPLVSIGNNFKIPTNIFLADPEYNKTRNIDILLGADMFWKLLSVGRIKLGDNAPFLQKTLLGWILVGSFSPNCTYSKNSKHSTNLLALNNCDLSQQLEKFWQLEEIKNDISNLTDDETFCENHFITNFKRDSTGRFIVKIPFKDNKVHLGDSKSHAVQRFLTLERKFHKNSLLKVDYVNFINEYIQLGHMSEVKNFKIKSNNQYFLPHRTVRNKYSLKTKPRDVFQSSGKSSSALPMCDVHYTGTSIRNDLFTKMLRFRMPTYASLGDTSKIYRQIIINENGRQIPTDNSKTCELNTVTYGTAPGSFLAIRYLKQLAK
ncbi:uncharacterized protein LOC113371093 [Ctenocephalides felis]|uniref:uncharacterized protein LOC113371093 n=1 Tax=Ctenocephalides felis TaxID=7515 RepID=UPI000E6E5582|nr:uncharacterized protein LOC113371093 [Ctenocephalides felis]